MDWWHINKKKVAGTHIIEAVLFREEVCNNPGDSVCFQIS